MSTALITASQISHSFPDRGVVLNNINFKLFPGDRVALTGQNGAGKTTLFHIFVGLIKHQKGELIVFDKLRSKESDFIEVRANLGLLFQDPDDQLFCPTALEEVAFGPLNLGKTGIEAIRIARKTLDRLGMTGFEEKVTHKLSGGEKQMIALASVLAMDPTALLLDEPSNALDPAARQLLISTLQSLPQAMIIISHDSDFLNKLANRWVKLEAGELVEIDAPQGKPVR